MPYILAAHNYNIVDLILDDQVRAKHIFGSFIEMIHMIVNDDNNNYCVISYDIYYLPLPASQHVQHSCIMYAHTVLMGLHTSIVR